MHIYEPAQYFMKCLLPSLNPFTVLLVLLNLEVNSLKRSLAKLLFKKTHLLNVFTACAVFVWKCTHFELPVNSVTVQPVCYCRAFLNTSCFLQNCWRAAGFVYRRTVVWREVGKISFSPSGPSLCVHSQAAQPGISSAQQEPDITCSVSLLPFQDNIPASISCSKLRFCCVSLNWELFCANIQNGDLWLGDVKLEWWLLSDWDWETAKLLAGTALSSLWATAEFRTGCLKTGGDCNLVRVRASQEQ